MELRLAKNKYVQLSELGSRFNLSFSGQLILNRLIIALDGLKQRLLVFATDKPLDEAYVIALNKIAAVTVKKTYSSIRPGELRNKRMEEFLKRIDLQFQYRDNRDLVVLPFYQRETDEPANLGRLEKDAKNWQIMLAKIAGLQTAREFIIN